MFNASTFLLFYSVNKTRDLFTICYKPVRQLNIHWITVKYLGKQNYVNNEIKSTIKLTV